MYQDIALRRFFQVAGGLSALFLVLVLPAPASAQEVIGVSAILNSTSASEIDTYSATEMDAATAYYYDAYVEGYLFQNNSLIAEGAAIGNPTASGELSEPLTVGDTYEIDSYHYLVAYYAYTEGINNYYYNPYNYLIYTGDIGNPSGSGFLSGGGPTYYTTEYLYLGYTYVVLSTGVPTITSISPAGGSINTSGTITLQGTNLEDPFTQTTTPAISGSGVTLTVQSVSPTQVTLGYVIAQSASTGPQNITLTTRFGTSNAVSFNVGDATPVVTSITPNVWPAGANTSVMITGTGFGTNPTVSVSGGWVTVSRGNASDTSISATLTVAPAAPTETVTVQVQSNGYGSGFISTTQGQSPVGNNTANISAIPAPVPQITLGTSQTNIAGTTQSVYIGQQIALTSSVSLPQGLSIASQSWTSPPGASVGNFAVTDGVTTFNEQITTSPIVSSNASGMSTTYYWIDQGSSRQMTYNYTMSNGQPNSATVTFNVSGPTWGTGGAFTATPGQVNVWPDNVAFNGLYRGTGIASLEFGNAQTNSGMTFQVQASPPTGNAGMFQWVQLWVTSRNKYLTAPIITPDSIYGPGLDNWYPYVTSPGNPNTTNDSPGMELAATHNGSPIPLGEGAESFSATMYLMWDPAVPSGCSPASTVPNGNGGYTSTPSNCTESIPVPLGYITWGFGGDAINKLQYQTSTNTQWLLNFGAPKPTAPLFQQASSYPQWSSTVNNNL